jgi:ligand-binding sensor domain-containing protein
MHLSAFKKIILSIGLLLYTFCSYGAEQERYLHFTETDGLPRNIATCLEKDQYGYIWIGTTNGIARYDGKDFYTYKELSGITIIYLLYDSKNNLWAASTRGLYKYNRLTNCFELMVQGYISKVQEDNGDIYFILLSAIYKINGNKNVLIYQESSIMDFCFSQEGMWLGKGSEGVWLLSRVSGFKKVVARYPTNNIVLLTRKIDDKLFVANYNGQLYSISDNGKLELRIIIL